MDCSKGIGYPAASFDAVIDKGLLDALLCSERMVASSERYVAEVARVLRPGGVFVVVSFGAPEIRLSFLEGDYGWRVAARSLPKPNVDAAALPEGTSPTDPNYFHFAYVCTKGAPGAAGETTGAA